jgi:hypothetical protein
LVTAWADDAGGAPGQKIVTPPDHYAALDPFFEGEIVAIREGGGVIKIATVQMSPDIGEMVPGGDAGRGTWIELRYANGWVFFDSPGDEPQRRYNLRDGRQRFEIGQIIAIGREPTEGGGWDRTSIGGLTRGGAFSAGTQVRLRGWVLARVTPFREDRGEGL